MTSVSGLWAAAGLTSAGIVRWGQKPSLLDPGVYIVATTRHPDERVGPAAATVDPEAVASLLAVRPEATVDGRPASAASVANRLRAMWVPDEPVVYIGLTTRPVSERVDQYYKTKIGANGPHAGGWPLKMLANLDQMWVHYAAADDPDTAEKDLMRAFRSGLTDEVVAGLHDPNVVLPYANLEFTKGVYKAHGLSGVKTPRTKSVRPTPGLAHRVAASTAATAGTRPALVTGSQLQTQNITRKDIERGKIRVPSGTKRIFPPRRATVEVELCGEHLTCQWDPRYDPDRERSGVVSVSEAVLGRLVVPGRPLGVTTAHSTIRMGYPT